MSSRNTAAAVVSLGVAFGIVGLSWWAGHAYTDSEHDAWELAALVLTGVGTTALASVTGFLAWETRSDVRASRQVADTAAEQLRTSIRPLLVPEGNPYGIDGDGRTLVVRLTNIGAGPAVIYNQPNFTDLPATMVAFGKPSVRAIARDASVELTFNSPEIADHWPGTHEVEVEYTDVDGTQLQRTTTRLHLEMTDDGPNAKTRGFKLERLDGARYPTSEVESGDWLDISDDEG